MRAYAGVMSTEIDPDEVIAQVSQRLADKYPDLDRADIDRTVRAELAQLIDRPVQDYLSVLTERAAKKSLKKAR
ncbi:MAG: hypothetical protein JWP32_1731 [Schumannella sp.]|nr:hypothetical protein [Schumannella sp.]